MDHQKKPAGSGTSHVGNVNAIRYGANSTSLALPSKGLPNDGIVSVVNGIWFFANRVIGFFQQGALRHD